MEILDGKIVSGLIKQMIKERIEKEKLDPPPCLACILVGDDPASQIYVANKEKACAQVGIKSIIKRLPADSSFEDVASTINKLNNDASVNGILLQLPLPKGLDEKKLISLISPNKDVDGLTELNLGRLFSKNTLVAPCTATGIIDILKHYNVQIDGKEVVVVGRSLLVGKSVANMLEQLNATVTICHSHTRDLAVHTRRADILVVAIGKPNFITADMIKPGAVVIDVGINRIEGKIVGDVNFEDIKDKCDKITPVPGGVGPMTIAELLKNTMTLYDNSKQNSTID